jgi:two-component system, NarL family, sensor histidine kinase UhpB
LNGRELPLFWRIFIPNALVLLGAGIVLVITPARVDSEPGLGQVAVIALCLLAMLAINLLAIRRALDPLGRLAALMERIDPLEPGQRVDARGGGRETERVGEVFNRMLERLEIERRESGRRMLAAQESERLRVARELHDEVGQVATSLTLEIDHAARVAGPEVRERLVPAREAARELSSELGEIVRRLRPETLDDLGLASALTVLADGLAEGSELTVRRKLAPVRWLPGDIELALYRVAQESLTNVLRHADARVVSLTLEADGRSARLRVADDGRGMNGAAPSNGIRGMRERAMLLGGTLRIVDAPDGGVEVELTVPLPTES